MLVRSCLSIRNFDVDKCRLQHYFGRTPTKDDLSGLSDDDCLTAFKFWAISFRVKMPDAPVKERLMCPMLWCREMLDDYSLDDHSLMLRHLQGCKLLSDTWYWCPQHSHPENYMGYSTTAFTHLPRSLSSRNSSVKKAMAFFKSLGHKSSIKEKSDLVGVSTFIGEVAGGDIQTSGLPSPGFVPLESDHRPATVAAVLGPQAPPQEMASYARSESRPSVAEMPTRLTHFQQHELSEPERERDSASFELPANTSSIFSNPELCSYRDSKPSVSSHTTLSHTEDDRANITSDSEGFHQVPTPNLAKFQSSEHQVVERLWDFFLIVERKLKQSLESALDQSCKFRWSSFEPFELGVETLRCWYKGVSPSSFEQVFALMHLAATCAYFLHSEDDLFCWDEFARDMLEWRHLITNQTGKLLFENVIKGTFLPTVSSPDLSATSNRCYTNFDGDGSQILGKGQIISVCSEFLAGKSPCPLAF